MCPRAASLHISFFKKKSEDSKRNAVNFGKPHLIEAVDEFLQDALHLLRVSEVPVGREGGLGDAGLQGRLGGTGLHLHQTLQALGLGAGELALDLNGLGGGRRGGERSNV